MVEVVGGGPVSRAVGVTVEEPASLICSLAVWSSWTFSRR